MGILTPSRVAWYCNPIRFDHGSAFLGAYSKPLGTLFMGGY